MLCACVCFAVIGIIGSGINNSIVTTNKYSFKAVGLLHRKGSPEKRSNEVYYVVTGNETIKNSTNSANSTESTNNSTVRSNNETTLVLLRNETSFLAEMDSDLNDMLLFSSFNCFLTFPSSITDYINNTFVEQFHLSHIDIFKDQQTNDKKLPLLKSVFTSCYADQNCSTFFEYDKQYGIDTSHDSIKQVDDMFHCCSYDHINQTSETCKKAKPSVERSLLSQSKRPVLLVSKKGFL